jgi:hypothetical protein
VRKTLSILILSAFLTHLVGFYAYFVVRQSQIRKEMRESIGSLPIDQFEVFTFTPEEYQKIKVNGHEVKINGKMYDHSAPKVENGRIILYAKHDKSEDNLLSFLNEVVTRASDDSKPVPSVLMNFLSLHFISTSSLQFFSTSESEKIFDQYQANLIQQYFPVLSPPPKS